MRFLFWIRFYVQNPCIKIRGSKLRTSNFKLLRMPLQSNSKLIPLSLINIYWFINQAMRKMQKFYNVEMTDVKKTTCIQHYPICIYVYVCLYGCTYVWWCVRRVQRPRPAGRSRTTWKSKEASKKTWHLSELNEI